MPYFKSSRAYTNTICLASLLLFGAAVEEDRRANKRRASQLHQRRRRPSLCAKRRRQAYMATLRNVKIKTATCKRIIRELHSYEKEVESEAAKTAEMKDEGADPYDLKQQETVLTESRMMIPERRRRLEASLSDLEGTLVELDESSQQEGAEINEARRILAEGKALFSIEEV